MVILNDNFYNGEINNQMKYTYNQDFNLNHRYCNSLSTAAETNYAS